MFVPLVQLAVGLFAWGCFSVGWACLADWFARVPETALFLAEVVRKTLLAGAFCYGVSVIMMGVELGLANS